MILFLQRTVLFSLIASSVACQRAAEDKASLVISLPPSEKLNAFTCTTCLKFLAVNITGEGISSVIYAKKELGNFNDPNTQITPEIEIEVPVGKQRYFQLLAAYSNAAGQIEIRYGTTTADLSSTTNQLSMTLSAPKVFQGGHIAGRYLSGLSPDMGPTGIVNINLIPEPGHRPFTLLKTHIINGWFDFFASKNFEVSYELETGGQILPTIKLDRDYSQASLSSSTQIARIVRPSSYDRFNGTSWEAQNEDDTDLVIGYFFAPGFADVNKRICKHNSPSTLTRLSSDGGTTNMMYDPMGVTGDVRVYGGNSTCGGGGLPNQQYTQNVISLVSEQFNGMGNDTAKSLEGAFTYFKDSGQLKKYVKAANTVIVHFLPNTLNTIYDGARLYIAASEPSDRDNILCDPKSLTGFAPVSSSSTITGDEIAITASVAVNSGYGLVCPTLGGELRGHGGMYLGSLAAPGSPALLTISDGSTYNYGTVANGSVVNHQFTISNVGGSNAAGLGGTGLAAPFQFVGGSFPGTGGTCGAGLMPSATCTVVVSFTPVAAIASSGTFIVGYNDSVAAQTVSRNIMGTGATPANLTITGNNLTGVVTAGTPVYELYTVTNSGGVTATGMSSASLSVPFYFPGASYPGSGGGTCGASLAAGTSCQIRVEYTAINYSTINGTIQIPYNNGNTNLTATLNITGTGT